MGRYVDHTLSANETVIANAKPHWAMFIAPMLWLIFGLVLLVPLVVAIPMLILRLMTFYGTELAVTNKRVIAKTGVISRNVIDVALPKVEGITYQQGVFGRVFGYGSIFVRGTGLGHVPIKFIAHPELFKSDVDKMVHV
jgi:uncharacterized membrane protein YdbT with pleckstrin-like domain